MDEIIKSIEMVLAAAKAGDLTEIVFAARSQGRQMAAASGDSCALVGMIEVLHRRLMNRAEQDIFPAPETN